MIALAVDDEFLMLEMLTNAIIASPDIDSVYDFSSCTAALDWARRNKPDVAFLDISMRGMGGIELAEKIQEIHPNCKVVFCTGYSEYAVDAFRLHVSGYIMKPVTPQAVQTEIDYIKGGLSRSKTLEIKCFGSFEVLSQGKPLRFKRSKTQELLAYLVDRNGAGVTARQICAALWEDDLADSRHMNYFWQLLDDLRSTLRSIDAENILVKVGNRYAVDTDSIDCDYVRHLKTGLPAFRGEYMSQYSWAEETAGFLY